MKRKAILFLVGCMIMTTVAGCNFLPPKTAMDVVERYQAALAKTENFRLEGEIDLEMGVSISGDEDVNMSMDIPINMELEAVTDIKDNVFLNMDVSMEVMGEQAGTEVEAYIQRDGEDLISYVCADNEEWLKSELDNEEIPDVLTGEMDASQFETATFEKKDDKYIITLKMGEISESEMFEDMLKENDELFANVDVNEVLEQLEDTKAIYTFDEKCMLEKMELADFKFSQEAEEDGMVMEISLEMSAEMRITDYGEIEKDAYMLPDDIKKEAVEESEQPKNTEEPMDGPLEEPTEEPTEEPVEEPVEEPTEEPTEDPVEEPTEEPEEEPTEEPNNGGVDVTSGELALYDFDGKLLCEVNCPQNFKVTEASESYVSMEGEDGFGFTVYSFPDTWMEEFANTGTYTKDEEFYSYEEVSVYDEFESSYGTVTILQWDWIMTGFEDLGMDTTYGVMINMGEYSPAFTVSIEDLEGWGTDIDTLAREVFK